MAETKQKFEGFYVPNSTQVPDSLFDELMADLSGAELKTVLYIIRRTFGFKRQSDTISINQMLTGITKKDGKELDRGTGLSKPALLKALRDLAKKNIIIPTRKFDERGGYMPTEYRLNILSQPPQQSGDDTPSKESLPSPLGKKNLLGLVKKVDKPLVKKVAIQDTGLQDTVFKTVNVGNGSIKKQKNKTDLRKLPDIDQPKEHIRFMADTILTELGDSHSQGFYYLVASKIPEQIIRKTLSEIRNDGARNPAKVFSYRMKLYAQESSSLEKQKDIRAMVNNLAIAKNFFSNH